MNKNELLVRFVTTMLVGFAIGLVYVGIAILLGSL